MIELPATGTRVALRYRRPAGSVPPLTDVIGILLEHAPLVRVQTKAGAVVEVGPDDVVAVRELTAAPVRASQIRATEHAAALAWPGTEQQWIDGWLLRAAGGHTHRGNSAVPLDVAAGLDTLPTIIDWYHRRGLTPWLSVPERLVRLSSSSSSAAPGQLATVVMVRELPSGTPQSSVTLMAVPDEMWLRGYAREVPLDVLTAVVDGDVVFGRVDAAAVGRAAVTTAPDGHRWVGLSAVRVAEDQRRRGHARTLCAALLDWGARRGADRAYVQVLVDNAGALALYESMGFTAQHRSRYLDAASWTGRRL